MLTPSLYPETLSDNDVCYFVTTAQSFNCIKIA